VAEQRQKDALARRDREILELTETVDARDASVASLEARVAELTGDVERLELALKDADPGAQAELRAAHDALERRAAAADADLAEAREKIAAAESSNSEVDEQRLTLVARVSGMEEVLRTAEERHAAAAQEAAASLESAESRIAEAEARADQVTARAEEIAVEVDVQRDRVEVAEKMAAEAEAARETAVARIAELEAQVADATAQIESLSSRVAELEAQVDSLESCAATEAERHAAETETLRTEAAAAEARGAQEADTLKQSLEDLAARRKVDLRKQQHLTKDLKESLAREIERREEAEINLAREKQAHAAIVASPRVQQVVARERLLESMGDTSVASGPSSLADQGDDDSSSLGGIGGGGGGGGSSRRMLNVSLGAAPAESFDAPGNDETMLALRAENHALILKFGTLQSNFFSLEERCEAAEATTSALRQDIAAKTQLLKNFILREKSNTVSGDDGASHRAAQPQVAAVMSQMPDITRAKNSRDMLQCYNVAAGVNAKLSAVCEDALLENIRLRADLQTLGTEMKRVLDERRREDIGLQSHGSDDQDEVGGGGGGARDQSGAAAAAAAAESATTATAGKTASSSTTTTASTSLLSSSSSSADPPPVSASSSLPDESSGHGGGGNPFGDDDDDE
jgi:uncharacterized coiled-coil protein SlyX